MPLIGGQPVVNPEVKRMTNEQRRAYMKRIAVLEELVRTNTQEYLIRKSMGNLAVQYASYLNLPKEGKL